RRSTRYPSCHLMQIVIVHRGLERELELQVEDPEACVSELLQALDVDPATVAGVALDGTVHGPAVGLDEIPLYEGATLTVVDGPVLPAAPSVPGAPVLAGVG